MENADNRLLKLREKAFKHNSYLVQGRRGLKIAFFGTLPPLTERLASTSSGMLVLLSNSNRIDSIDFYGQVGAKIPDAASDDKIDLKETWRIDSPISLIRTMVRLVRSTRTDTFFFNLYLTMFGRRRLSNVIGLLMPIVVSKLTKKRVVVYMHNFIETEDAHKLGYKANFFSVAGVSLLEKMLIRNTIMIVPRPSQKEILEMKYHGAITSLIIPYVEGISSIIHEEESRKRLSILRNKVNVLLFGRWGPQKDLESGLHILSDLIDAGCNIHVTVAGSVNSNFPEYERILLKAMNAIPKQHLDYVGDVPEESVPRLFYNSDILFLPYVASGGYSAVMNLGALYGLRVVAYDIEQLRENDGIIGARTLFINPSEQSAVSKLKAVVEQVDFSEKQTQFELDGKLRHAEIATDALIDRLSCKGKTDFVGNGQSSASPFQQ